MEKNENGRKNGGKEGNNAVLIAAIAIVLALAAIGAYLFLGASASQAQPSTPAPTPASRYGLESEEAKLILNSFERAAGIKDYNVSFNYSENGRSMKIEGVRKGNLSWLRLEEESSVREGFFENGSNGTGTVCLTYLGKTKCTRVEGQEVSNFAANIRAWELGSKEDNLAQKEVMKKLIGAGAIRISGPAKDEKVGPFAAKKITYVFSLENMTVKELEALGFSPNDPSVLVAAEVSRWVDSSTGLVVKYAAKRTQKGVLVGENSAEYSHIDFEPASVPVPENLTLVSPQEFMRFFSDSQQDFLAKETCKSQRNAKEADMCYKTMAARINDASLCSKISNKTDEEACRIIVAKNTANASLCENLTEYYDDCLIVVAGENGNATLCQLMKNSSNIERCSSAAAEGKRKVDEREKALQHANQKKNCVLDSDCALFGDVCAPKNSKIANESSPYHECLASIPCICDQGFCSFVKNETYYQCINKIEERQLRELISKKIEEANENSTANSTNASA